MSVRRFVGAGLAISMCALLPSAALAAPTWRLVAVGQFSISPDGSQVTGKLPPGSSVSRPPLDPSDKGEAQRYRGASKSNLAVAAPGEGLAPIAFARTDFSGCVGAISSVTLKVLAYKGQMAGCRRGKLWLHTYLNNGSQVRVQDGEYNTCTNSTECSVVYNYFTVGCPATHYNYAHGRNLTTGGDDTSWQAWVCYR